MKFHKILGKCDPQIITEAEGMLSSTFTELAMGYKTKAFGSKLGGDVFLHQLISPLKHICDARGIEFNVECEKMHAEFEAENVPEEQRDAIIAALKKQFGNKLLYTAATNGSIFYWAPQFIIKQSKIGLRLIVGHEGWHSIYMHPSRRGSRNPALWNIAVDFKVNFTLMDDLRLRDFRHPEEVFQKELGDFITLKEYGGFLKDPFNPPAKLALWNPTLSMKHTMERMANPGYKNPDDKEPKSLYFAEPQLADDMKRPENIYDYLFNQIPKCSTCGKIGVWKKPEAYKKLEKQLKEMQADMEDHSNDAKH
jgi:hypothetical protein